MKSAYDRIPLSAGDEAEISAAARALAEGCVSESEALTESFVYDQLMKLKEGLASPEDLEAFIERHEAEIKAIQSGPASPRKSVLTRAWECLKYALAKGLAFAKRHWKKIILVALVVAAALLFRKSDAATRFGLGLFGKGAARGFDPAADASARAPRWEQIDAEDVDTSVVVQSGEEGSRRFQTVVKSTGQTAVGVLSDPDDDESPVLWFRQVL